MEEQITTWKSIKPEFVTFDAEGLTVEGKLIGVENVQIREMSVPKYQLMTPEGSISFLGTTQLVEALSSVTLGSIIRVVYKGEVKGGQYGKYKDFDVFVGIEGS